MVREELERMSAPFVFFNQRRFEATRMMLEVCGTRAGGWLEVDGQTHALGNFRAIYARLMDDRSLPELEGEPQDSPRRTHCRRLHELLTQWFEIVPCPVINRASAMGSNHSKPYQAQILKRHGFHIPQTVITSEPAVVREFSRKHERVIYKSISGVRSIVKELTRDDLERLDQLRWCPVQFQEYVEGTDVRVHTIGEKAIATEVRTNAIDYRYAHREPGGKAELRPAVLSPHLTRRCVEVARSLGLLVAGIDLKIAPDGSVYCFEVNPSPAFSFFERQGGQPIALEIARYLAGER